MKVCKSGQFCENINFSVNTKQRGVLAEQMFTKSLVHFAHHHCHRHWSCFLCQWWNYEIMTMLSHSAISLQPIDAWLNGPQFQCFFFVKHLLPWLSSMATWMIMVTFAMNTRAIGKCYTFTHWACSLCRYTIDFCWVFIFWPLLNLKLFWFG